MVRCTSPRWLRPTWATIRVTQMDMSNFFKPTLFKWMVSGNQKSIPVYCISETIGCCGPKKNYLGDKFHTIYSKNYKILTCSRSHGQQCCTADISWGPDQHGSAQRIQQRVLTISTHRMLLTHDTRATALFTWSIYFRSSLRGEPLLLALLMPFSTQENTCMRSMWHRGVRVL